VSDTSARPASSSTPGPQRPSSLAGCLLEIAWSLGGFALLLVVWVAILREASWSLSWRDALYWGAALGMLVARGVHFARFGSTGDGRRATARDLGLYAAGLIGGSAAAWTLAQSFDL
jgi:hypothetical protein